MSYYDILGVDSKASLGEIKKAFRERALRLHPDTACVLPAFLCWHRQVGVFTQAACVTLRPLRPAPESVAEFWRTMLPSSGSQKRMRCTSYQLEERCDEQLLWHMLRPATADPR
jgi:hypothetical protein